MNTVLEAFMLTPKNDGIESTKPHAFRLSRGYNVVRHGLWRSF